MHVLIIGAGGHGQVAADIFLAMHDTGQNIMPVGFIDTNLSLIGTKILGLPVLGHDADLRTISHDAVFVGIGKNSHRRHIFENLKRSGECFALAIHPTTIIGRNVKLSPGCMVCARTVINVGTRIGENCILNTGCIVEHHNIINNHAHIGPGVVLGGGCVVGEEALIGLGATVLPFVHIGKDAVVGAGSVAYKNVSDKTIIKNYAAL